MKRKHFLFFGILCVIGLVVLADSTIHNLPWHNATPSQGDWMIFDTGTTNYRSTVGELRSVVGGSQVWTNDGTYTSLVTTNATNHIFFRNSDGSLFAGKGVEDFSSNTGDWNFPTTISYVESNGPAMFNSRQGVYYSTGDQETGYLERWVAKGITTLGIQVGENLNAFGKVNNTYVSLMAINGSDITNVASGYLLFRIPSYPVVSLASGSTDSLATGIPQGLGIDSKSVIDLNGNITALGVFTGNGSGITNISAVAITNGLTYNLSVVTNGTDTATLYFTNGVLMRVTAP